MIIPIPTLPVPVVPLTYAPEPVLVDWEASGNWHRNADYEWGLNVALDNRGGDLRAYVATLDASADTWASDLSLSLGCIGESKVMYLTPYWHDVSVSIDTYTIGIWNNEAGEWVEDQRGLYNNPGLTDDGSAIYIANDAQIREIVDIIQEANTNQIPEQVLNVGMWNSESEDEDLWGNMDPVGLEDALSYLPCF